MKVALINTSDSGGGAAEACMRLLKALQLQQVDVTMVVQHKKRAEDAVYTIERNIFGKLRSNINFLLERISFMLFQERDKQVRFAFSPANAGTDISQLKVIKEADIIHLHWTNSGFLSINDVKNSSPLTNLLFGRYTICGPLPAAAIMQARVTISKTNAAIVIFCGTRRITTCRMQAGCIKKMR